MAYVQAKQQIYANSRYGRNLLIMDQVDDICIGLPNDATRTALWTHHETMEDFLERARARQRYDEAEARRIKEKVRISESHSQPSKKKNESRATGSKQSSKTNDSEKTSEGTKSEHKNQPGEKKVFYKKRYSDECYNCGKLNHIAKNCPEPKTEKTIRAEARRASRELSASSTTQPQANCFIRSTRVIKSTREDLPVIVAKINGGIIEVCIDTGANVSVINAAKVPKKTCQYPWIGARTIEVLGRSCEAMNTISACIEVESVKVDLPNIIVVEALPVDMLLGSDWRSLANVLYAVHANNDVMVVPEDEMASCEPQQNGMPKEGKAL